MKKGNAFKVLSEITAILLVIAVVSGCQSKEPEGEPKEAPSTKQQEVTQVLPEEPTEISIFYSNVTTLPNRTDTQYISTLQKLTNTSITIVDAPSGQAGSKLNLLIASGTAPDICQTDLPTLNKYGAEGAFIELGDIIDSQMPVAKKALSRDAITKLTASNGKIYALPYIFDTGTPGFFIRQDWLKKLDMTAPKTLDEYYNVLKAFKEKDPDGNEKDDTYGGSIQPNLKTFEYICGPFGIPASQWIPAEDGSLIYSNTSSKMKEALAFSAKLYEEGILDPEFSMQKQEQYDQKVTTSRYGLIIGASSAIGKYNVAINKTLPEGKFVLMSPPAAPGVEKPYSSTSQVIEDSNGKAFSSNFAGISKTAKNPSAIVRYLDWFFTEEGKRFSIFGVEGVHYSIVDGKPKFLSEYSGAANNAKMSAEIGSYRLVGIGEFKAGGKDSNWSQTSDETTVNNMITTPQYAFPKLVYFNTATGDSITGDVNKTIQEIFTKIIMGGLSLDDGWAQWLKEFDRLGGNKWTKEVNDAYKANKK